ncbi:MAG: FAD-dependent oxidoreductase [Myxococcota bacterium]
MAPPSSAAVVTTPFVEERDVARWDQRTGVLVIGLGCAGACAALEALRTDAEVLILERASGGGGTSALSGGVLYMGGGTPVQKAAGFEDSSEAMFRYLMASTGPRPDESKIERFCTGSLEHFDFIEGCGVEFKPVFYPHYSGEPPTDDGLVYSGNENAWPYNEIAQPAPRGHVPRIPGAAGGLLMQRLIAATTRAGARLLTDARATSLVRARDGSVLGAAVQVAGETLHIRAERGVVLTTGGFINDDAMIDQHAPLLRRCSIRVGAEGDDGSGIRMGLAVGGNVIHLEMASISLPIHPPKSVSKGILVNRTGQRFINEDVYMGLLGEHVLFRQDGEAYLIFDDATFTRPEIDREIVGVGETPAELADELGIPAAVLEATLDIYNEAARRGEDPLFHKGRDYLVPLETAPFGALDCRVDHSPFAAFTLGGLETDADAAVLRPDGQHLPGLYAAGRAAAGIAAPGYASGLSLGDGSFFGRMAGRAAGTRVP